VIRNHRASSCAGYQSASNVKSVLYQLLGAKIASDLRRKFQVFCYFIHANLTALDPMVERGQWETGLAGLHPPPKGDRTPTAYDEEAQRSE
jgi:hypothetical protein